MGEQPLFTTKAHVFHIDPSTKKNWIPSSSGAINVAFYYDTNRSAYRIISVEGSKPIINSTMVPNMNFTKTSQKFGQWSDSRVNTVYGLGFGSEHELDQFALKFTEIKEMSKQQTGSHIVKVETHVNGGAGDQIDAIIKDSAQRTAVQNSEYMTPMLGDQRMRVGSSSAVDNTNQLKYENDRLKLALAQSSTNAKKWEAELQTLKNNNARLTAGLQESNQNVEEWKKQLNAYKEENARLKKLLIENEHQNSKQEMADMQMKLSQLMSQIKITEDEKGAQEQEVSSLRSKLVSMSNLENKERANEKLIQELRGENSDLVSKLNTSLAETEKLRSNKSKDKSELRSLHDSMNRSMTELESAHQQLARMMNA